MKSKILIIRFSSIGDIILTSPVVRCIKTQLIDCELHFVTKEAFKDTLIHNPYIDKLHLFKNDINEVLPELKKENFDVIVDLHNNLRSLRLKISLGKKALTFKKLNIQKFIAVNFKNKNVLPNVHIVDRYFDAVKKLGVVNDDKGLDYFINENEEFGFKSRFPELRSDDFIAIVAGGSYYTKQIPLNKLIEICRSTNRQFIVLGGKADFDIADELAKTCSNVINACGKLSLNESAFVIKQASVVVSSDTGLMHIAAAFKKKIYSLWGNTIPEFGMYPYKPGQGSLILEVKDLGCRPCSKLGFRKCPKGHFNCMNKIDVTKISL